MEPNNKSNNNKVEDAHESDIKPEEIEFLRSIWLKYDTQDKGWVSKVDINNAFKDFGHESDTLREVLFMKLSRNILQNQSMELKAENQVENMQINDFGMSEQSPHENGDNEQNDKEKQDLRVDIQDWNDYNDEPFDATKTLLLAKSNFSQVSSESHVLKQSNKDIGKSLGSNPEQVILKWETLLNSYQQIRRHYLIKTLFELLHSINKAAKREDKPVSQDLTSDLSFSLRLCEFDLPKISSSLKVIIGLEEVMQAWKKVIKEASQLNEHGNCMGILIKFLTQKPDTSRRELEKLVGLVRDAMRTFGKDNTMIRLLVEMSKFEYIQDDKSVTLVIIIGQEIVQTALGLILPFFSLDKLKCLIKVKAGFNSTIDDLANELSPKGNLLNWLRKGFFLRLKLLNNSNIYIKGAVWGFLKGFAERNISEISSYFVMIPKSGKINILWRNPNRSPFTNHQNIDLSSYYNLMGIKKYALMIKELLNRVDNMDKGLKMFKEINDFLETYVDGDISLSLNLVFIYIKLHVNVQNFQKFWKFFIESFT